MIPREVLATGAIESGTNAAIVAALRWLRVGIAVVDDERRLLSANAAAEEIFARATHLKVDGGHVVGAHQGATRALTTLLGACDAERPPSSVALVSAPGSGALEVLAVANDAPELGRCFVLMLNWTRDKQAASTEALQSLYRLTAAEAQLVSQVARGSAVAEAAAELGISIATARTHLHHALRKTATRRQAELVGLIASSLVDWVCFPTN